MLINLGEICSTKIKKSLTLLVNFRSGLLEEKANNCVKVNRDKNE